VSARGRVGRFPGRTRSPRTPTATDLPAAIETPPRLTPGVGSFPDGHERLATDADRAAVEGRVEVAGPPRAVLIRTVPLSLRTFLA